MIYSDKVSHFQTRIIFFLHPWSFIFLTYSMAFNKFSFVARESDGLHSTTLLSNTTRAKRSASWRSLRMACSASRVWKCEPAFSRTFRKSLPEQSVPLPPLPRPPPPPAASSFHSLMNSCRSQTPRSSELGAGEEERRSAQSIHSRSDGKKSH